MSDHAHRPARHLLRVPWDTTRALELALFRTFAVPSVAALLDSTGEFAARAQKRYDDTDLILSTIGEVGYDSAEGRARDPQDEPDSRALRDLERRLSVRPLVIRLRADPLECALRVAAVDRDRTLGVVPFLARRRSADGDQRAPGAVRGIRALQRGVRGAALARSRASERVGEATRDMFLAWFPGLPRRFGAQAIYALMDDRLLAAFGFPQPPSAVRAAVEGALRARARVVSALPSRRRPRLRTRRRTRPTAAAGYWTSSGRGGSASPAEVHEPLQREGRDAGRDDRREVDAELRERPGELVPVAACGRDPDVCCGRNRRHRDQHADQRSCLRVNDTTPAMPARTATITEYVFGFEMKIVAGWPAGVRLSGAGPEGSVSVSSSAAAIAIGKPTARVRGSARRDRAGADRSHHDPGERPELGSDDHGADDQDLRVGQDPDRGHEGRHDHECKEAEGDPAHGRARLYLFPDDSVGRSCGGGLPRSGQLWRSPSTSSTAIEPDSGMPSRAARRGSRLRPRVRHRKDHVPTRLDRSAGIGDHVDDRLRLGEQVERAPRQAGRNDAKVNMTLTLRLGLRSGT